MGLQIESGTGNGYVANVDSDNRLFVSSVVRSRAADASIRGDAYTITCEDAAAATSEYTLWIKNDSDRKFGIDFITVNNVVADSVWKIHRVTGTGGTAAAIVPVNMNFGSGKVAELTVLGGAGGVSGLTIVSTLNEFFGGAAYTRTRIDMDGALYLSEGTAIAIEYDAGTGSKVAIVVAGHFLND